MIEIVMCISGCFDFDSNIDFENFVYVDVRCVGFFSNWNIVCELLFDLNICYGKKFWGYLWSNLLRNGMRWISILFI